MVEKDPPSLERFDSVKGVAGCVLEVDTYIGCAFLYAGSISVVKR